MTMLSKKDYSELWGYLDVLISQYNKALSNETDDSKIIKQHKEIQRLRDLQNAIQKEIDSRLDSINSIKVNTAE